MFAQNPSQRHRDEGCCRNRFGPEKRHVIRQAPNRRGAGHGISERYQGKEHSSQPSQHAHLNLPASHDHGETGQEGRHGQKADQDHDKNGKSEGRTRSFHVEGNFVGKKYSRSSGLLPIRYSKEIIMNILATVPLRTASLRAIRRPGAVLYKILSKRTLICRLQYFIETTEWDEKYLFHKVIDIICLGVIIFSIIYFCFRPGAYLVGIVFGNYGQ
jgi:hypothetical protein